MPATTEPDSSNAQRLLLVAWLILAVVTIMAYRPSFDNAFISFDDRKYIYENPFLGEDSGLGAIWADIGNPAPKLHYNPLTYTSFWIEKELMGGAFQAPSVDETVPPPKLVHVNQTLLHVLNAFLLFLLARALGTSNPVALSAAFLFALHPVNVESVAWMSERKNLLSSAFFFGALLFYWHASADGTARRKSLLYAGALACSLAALLSKSVAVTLPPLLLLLDFIRHRRLPSRALLKVLPFALLSVAFALLTISREAGITNNDLAVPLSERWFALPAVPVHYLQSLLLPIRQAFHYPMWDLEPANPRFLVSVLVLASLTTVFLAYRRRVPAAAWFGLALFLVTVAPVSGVLYFAWLVYSFVADHYLYLGSAGLLLTATVLADRLLVRVANARARKVAAITVLAGLGLFYFVRVQDLSDVWQDDRTLWTETVRLNPDSEAGNFNLANHYARRAIWDEALPFYEKARELRPDNMQRNVMVARALRYNTRFDDALLAYRRARAMEAERYPSAWELQLEYALFLAGMGQKEVAIRELTAIKERIPGTQPRIDEWLALVQADQIQLQRQ